MEPIIGFFKELYTTDGIKNDILSELFNDRIPREMKEELSKEFTAEEVKASLTQMQI